MLMKNYEQFKRIIKFTAALVILTLQTSVYGVVCHQYYNTLLKQPLVRSRSLIIVGVYALILLIFTKTYGGYKVGYFKKFDIAYSHILSNIFANGISYIQLCLLGLRFMNVIPILIMTGIDIFIIICWTFASGEIYKKLYPPHKMLLLYGERPAEIFIKKLSSRSDKYQICAAMNVDKGMEAIEQVLKNFEAVMIWDIPSQKRNQILKYCFGQSIPTYFMPKLSDIIIKSADNIHLFDTPVLLSKNYGLTFDQKFIKRTMDIIISSIALIILSPLILIIAIAIKSYDRGPVFFKQDRCTLDGKVFHILKFRSMIVDAEKEGISIPATDQDPRITPIGRVIRKIRIDELPQLINIIAGDMSIVGPRPERTEHVEKYTKEISEFSFRMKVKGGLTGYAQVFGKYNTNSYDKLKLDLMYIQNYSLFLDFKLIFITIKILVRGESTKGFSDEEKDKIMHRLNLDEDVIAEVVTVNESDEDIYKIQ